MFTILKKKYIVYQIQVFNWLLINSRHLKRCLRGIIDENDRRTTDLTLQSIREKKPTLIRMENGEKL